MKTHQINIATSEYNYLRPIISACLPTDKTYMVNVDFIGQQQIQALNLQYRGKNSSTNVLSFCDSLMITKDLKFIGDIIFCQAIINKEAKQQNKSFAHHLSHMAVHGCLHLLGYDHKLANEANQMEAKEVQILQQFNIKNPYENL